MSRCIPAFGRLRFGAIRIDKRHDSRPRDLGRHQQENVWRDLFCSYGPTAGGSRRACLWYKVIELPGLLRICIAVLSERIPRRWCGSVALPTRLCRQ
jgi:hypothetical protein